MKTDTRDHGYAWVILAAAFLLNVFISGTWTSFGIYMVEFVEEFQAKKSAITLIGSIRMFIGTVLGGLIAGPVMRRFDCWLVALGSSLILCGGYMISAFVRNLIVMYIFFGLFVGTGFVTSQSSGIVAVQKVFNKKKALAAGIFMTGPSLAAFIWPPLTRWLIDEYTWKGAMFIESAIYLNCIAFSVLIRPSTKVAKAKEKLGLEMKLTKTATDTEDKDTTKLERKNYFFFIRENIPFLLFLLGLLGLEVGHWVILVYTPLKAKYHGIMKQKASILLSVAGILGCFFRPVFGFLGDRKWNNKTVMCGLCAVAVGMVNSLCYIMNTYTLMIIYVVIAGLFSSGYMSLMQPIMVEMVGLDNIEMGTSMLMTVLAIGNLILHSLAGAIIDATSDIRILFLVSGIAQIMSGCLIALIPWMSYCK